MACVMGRRCGPWRGRASVVSPSGTAQALPCNARIMKASANGDPKRKLPLKIHHRTIGLPFVTARRVTILGAFSLGVDGREGQPTVKVGSPSDSMRAKASDASCDASRIRSWCADQSPAPPLRWPVTPCPRRRCTTPAVPRSGHRHAHMDSPGGPAQHGARAMRMAAGRVIGG